MWGSALLQITYQLNTYLQRVEAVLGKGWENHVEGQKLKADGDAFRQKLNTQPLFEEWKKKVRDTQGIVELGLFCVYYLATTAQVSLVPVRGWEVTYVMWRDAVDSV